MSSPDTFEDWMKRQKLPQPMEDHLIGPLRAEFARDKVRGDELRARELSPGTTGGFSYAVAIEEDGGLRLSLWIKRSLNGECFVFQPRDPEWNPHASYHKNGQYHQKSYGAKTGVQQRQRLDQFKGTEHLGFFAGHGIVAPSCNASNFTSVLKVPQGILEGAQGLVIVDLVEPGIAPAQQHREIPGQRIVREETYKDVRPWLVVAIATTDR